MIGQTKRHSVYESCFNILIGYGVAILSQIIIYPFYGIHVPIQTNISIGAWFTIISLVRSYILRRLFNKIMIKRYEES